MFSPIQGLLGSKILLYLQLTKEEVLILGSAPSQE